GSAFHPRRINWSYRKRGSVQRTQTKTQRKKAVFTAKIRIDRIAPSTPCGWNPGSDQPPKKSVTVSEAATVMLTYSAMKNMANFIEEEYSVWYPATSSASASGRSNGRRLVSAKVEMKNTMNPTSCGKTFQRGMNPSQVPLCAA